jgi:hypothetical protein
MEEENTYLFYLYTLLLLQTISQSVNSLNGWLVENCSTCLQQIWITHSVLQICLKPIVQSVNFMNIWDTPNNLQTL